MRDFELSMPRAKKTMRKLSYGIQQPSELFEKLKWDAEKLTPSPHPYDVFNFILTSATLAEWIQKYYVTDSGIGIFFKPKSGSEHWELPSLSSQWIYDASCLPNKLSDNRRHISNALSICSHVANASKHFHWNDGGEIESIGENPSICNWYQYFFTSVDSDLYFEFKGENYGLQQIRGILIQFYAGLITYLES